MTGVVVYTAICGGYDELWTPMEQSFDSVALRSGCDGQVGDVDFVAFSDGDLPTDRGWEIRRLRGFDDLAARMMSRLPKSVPHRFFDYRRYRWAIWVDGSLEMTSPEFVRDMIAAMEGPHPSTAHLPAGSSSAQDALLPVGAFAHPRRDCIYQEAAVCAPLRKYAGYDLAGQVRAYREAGYPEHNGLLACGVLVWDLAHPRQPEVGEAWWREQELHGTMDQLSLPFVLWQHETHWRRLPGRLWGNQWFRLREHAGARDELQVNLGCADRLLDGWENVDIAPGPGVTVVDLRERWPWADGSVQRVLAADVIEHLPDKIFTMNELHRVLSEGCIAEIVVPTTDGPGAFQDPTHVSFWNRNSFRYYTAGDPYRERFAASYGITAAFRVMAEQVIETLDGPKLQIALAAVKP